MAAGIQMPDWVHGAESEFLMSLVCMNINGGTDLVWDSVSPKFDPLTCLSMLFALKHCS